MSIIIEQPENILVDSYSYFSPSLLEGFARTTNDIYSSTKIRRTSKFYNNVSLLSAREASTLYHNFYGIQGIQASIETEYGNQYTLTEFKIPAKDVRPVIGVFASIPTTPPNTCLLYTSPSPRDRTRSRMPSSA